MERNSVLNNLYPQNKYLIFWTKLTYIMSQDKKSTDQICNRQSNNIHCKYKLMKTILQVNKFVST